MKGYLSLSYMIAFAIFIIAVGFLVFHYFAAFEQKTEGYEISSKKLGEIYIFNKIITSRNCLSTGETGILNRTLLDSADGGEELDCAYLPDFGYYVEVEDIDTGEKWEFGYRRKSRIGKYKFFKIPVSIKNNDGTEVHEGKISVGIISMKDDLLIYLTGMAERAWVKGGLTKKFTVPDKDYDLKIEFKRNEICEKGGVCKKLSNAILEAQSQYIGTPVECSITYKKVGQKLRPTLNCADT